MAQYITKGTPLMHTLFNEAGLSSVFGVKIDEVKRGPFKTQRRLEGVDPNTLWCVVGITHEYPETGASFKMEWGVPVYLIVNDPDIIPELNKSNPIQYDDAKCDEAMNVFEAIFEILHALDIGDDEEEDDN